MLVGRVEEIAALDRMLAAVRDGELEPRSLEGLPELVVAALSEDEAIELLTATANRPLDPQLGRPIAAETAGRGLKLVPGLVLAIEPWFIADGDDGSYVDEDGWTLRTADAARAAHVEHAIAITADGPVILTARA